MDRSAKGGDGRSVRQEFLHAWGGYKQYAWGHDELRPLSKGYRDWYSAPIGAQAAPPGSPNGTSLLMTPVDALDTMVLMGLKDEAAEDRELIDKQLSFDKDIYVKNFEITIRLLGGLLSSYQLSGDRVCWRWPTTWAIVCCLRSIRRPECRMSS